MNEDKEEFQEWTKKLNEAFHRMSNVGKFTADQVKGLGESIELLRAKDITNESKIIK